MFLKNVVRILCLRKISVEVNSVNIVQAPDYEIRELSSGNKFSSKSMYACAENNVKFSVFQQMPDNTRARRLCWGTSLQASIDSINKGDRLVETNTNTNTHAPSISVSHTNFQFRKANVQVGQVEYNHKAAVNESNQPHVNTLHYGQVIPLCRVHFTLLKFNNVCNQQTHVVFITSHDTGASMWTYYLQGHHPYVNFV